ncbi:hypothetical protein CEXT_793491 [Caerostris extrusa]|uniref:Uncharacterized protein n=1 Tax=Caerostris extrusa TaxID=172846 RepID=A0AAV4ST41_CAEEX|nr:hypothetical protein CEXT_793491 [Caerostris extrusa]
MENKSPDGDFALFGHTKTIPHQSGQQKRQDTPFENKHPRRGWWVGVVHPRNRREVLSRLTGEDNRVTFRHGAECLWAKANEMFEFSRLVDSPTC